MALDVSCVHWNLTFPGSNDVVVHIRSYHELTDSCGRKTKDSKGWFWGSRTLAMLSTATRTSKCAV